MWNNDNIRKEIEMLKANIAANENMIKQLSQQGFLKCIHDITTTNNELRARIEKLIKQLQ